MEKVGDFRTFVENFLFAYRQFCLNEFLHKEVEHDLYEKYIQTWNVFLRSLEIAYLLGLAKIFDRSGESGRTISVYHFLDQEFDSHAILIEKIRALRNKLFVHLDVKKMRNKEEFLKENKLDREEIRNLFHTINNVVCRLGVSFELTDDFKSMFEQTREEARNEGEKWLRSFR